MGFGTKNDSELWMITLQTEMQNKKIKTQGSLWLCLVGAQVQAVLIAGAAAVRGAAQQNTSILNTSFHPVFSLQDLFIMK